MNGRGVTLGMMVAVVSLLGGACRTEDDEPWTPPVTEDEETRGKMQEPVTCGGIAGIPCPGNASCVDDWRDDCAPPTGADCGGICVDQNGDMLLQDSDGTEGKGDTCGNAVCGAGEYCCNASCSLCVPEGNSCTQQVCEDHSVPCGGNTCGVGEYCCNESCGICAPLGGACTQQVCTDE